MEAIRAHASAPGAIEGAFAALAPRFPDVTHAWVPIGASGDGHSRAAAQPRGPPCAGRGAAPRVGVGHASALCAVT